MPLVCILVPFTTDSKVWCLVSPQSWVLWSWSLIFFFIVNCVFIHWRSFIWCIGMLSIVLFIWLTESSLRPVIILKIRVLDFHLAFQPFLYIWIQFGSITNFWRSHVNLCFHVSWVSVLPVLWLAHLLEWIPLLVLEMSSFESLVPITAQIGEKLPP